MTSSVVAQRYAQALFNETTTVSSVTDDVALLIQTLSNSSELERCLKSPVIPRHKKSAILQTLFAEYVHAVTLRFLQMLVQRGRGPLLSAILDRFLVLSDESQGITPVHARVYSELSEDEQARLQSVLSTRLNRTVRLQVTEDPALMGGIVLEIGDTVYDGSVQHQLSLLQGRLHVQA